MELRLGDRILTLEESRVMGILNVTPDSFSDGGRYLSADAAFEQAASMSEQGADIIDVGGESTRPGAEELPVQHELDRHIIKRQPSRCRFIICRSFSWEFIDGTPPWRPDPDA